MTDEINPSELGAFTNNLSNKEGIKKLIKAVEDNASDIATKQDKLTAGDNIAISDQNVISATDTKYTAGDNITISDQNVISATDTKYTAGTGITISEQNVISASGGGSGWTLRTANDNWADLFYYDTSTHNIKALKDIVIYLDNQFLAYVNKDFEIYDSLKLKYNDMQQIDSSVNIFKEILVRGNKMGGTFGNFDRNKYTLTYNTTTNKLEMGNTYTDSVQKNAFKIYIKE